MVRIKLIPVAEFKRIRRANLDKYRKLELISDMCRANTIASVKRAGSGHLGSSFSSLDIVVWLYYEEMNTVDVGLDSSDRDIYFSSKGHDVPGLYSVLFSLEVIPREKFLKLRRLGGLDGHPDVCVRGIESNSGSLGMGISKGKGMAWAKEFCGYGGRVFVMIGDGELQEGQVYEAFHTAAHQNVTNLNVILDHNKVQTDKLVKEITNLGDLEAKFRGFGWHVSRCNGHDFKQLEQVFTAFKSIEDKPKIVIADTIKGRGVSFMEHTSMLKANRGLYPWHAGAPDDESFKKGHDEIIERINLSLSELGLSHLFLEEVEPEQITSSKPSLLLGEPVSEALDAKIKSSMSEEYVAKAFGGALVEIAEERKDMVVLDADLSSDCRIRDFEKTYPERFIENGIAEQDMVSMAGGLARTGLLPVVNTFASFLASRANEQIYNNASEKTKIIYACHYSGLIPAGPGKSHQSIRDISLFGALPNMIILQPCNAMETRLVLIYCVDEAKENCMIRLAIGPSPRAIELPDDYQLSFGKGVTLYEGKDAVLFSYGPVMLNEALIAAEILQERGFSLCVVNMPWLNRIDNEWLSKIVKPYRRIYVLEDHAPTGGLGDFLLNKLEETGLIQGRRLVKFAVEGYPACGTPPQALKFHGLDGISLAERILRNQGREQSFLEIFRSLLKNPEQDPDRLDKLMKNISTEFRASLKKFPSQDWEERFKHLKEVESLFEKESETFILNVKKIENFFKSQEKYFAANYIKRKTLDEKGLRIKRLRQQPEYRPFQKALSFQMADLREQVILDAIKECKITWDKTLSKEDGYGEGMDERVIEIPLAFDIGKFSEPGKILDAGASLNLSFLRKYIGKPEGYIVHLTQSGDKEMAMFEGSHVSYVFGDLRRMDFKDETFDRILCISTFEHIGMDNTRYGAAMEHDPGSYIDAFKELLRVLKPGGKFLITVPYGIRKDFGWYHIFDEKDISKMNNLAKCCLWKSKYYYYEHCWYEGTNKIDQSEAESIQDDETVTGLAAILIEKASMKKKRK